MKQLVGRCERSLPRWTGQKKKDLGFPRHRPAHRVCKDSAPGENKPAVLCCSPSMGLGWGWRNPAPRHQVEPPASLLSSPWAAGADRSPRGARSPWGVQPGRVLSPPVLCSPLGLQASSFKHQLSHRGISAIFCARISCSQLEMPAGTPLLVVSPAPNRPIPAPSPAVLGATGQPLPQKNLPRASGTPEGFISFPPCPKSYVPAPSMPPLAPDNELTSAA